jgi:hypothetical protein
MSDISTFRTQLLGVIEQAQHRFAATTDVVGSHSQIERSRKERRSKQTSTKRRQKAKKSKRSL